MISSAQTDLPSRTELLLFLFLARVQKTPPSGAKQFGRPMFEDVTFRCCTDSLLRIHVHSLHGDDNCRAAHRSSSKMLLCLPSLTRACNMSQGLIMLGCLQLWFLLG